MSTGLALPRVPERIIVEPVLSNEEFEQLCAANADLRLERTREGVILVRQLASTAQSTANAAITYQLRLWWKSHRRGRSYDSSLGVFLLDGSAFNPSSSYVSEQQARRLRAEDLDHFLPFAPAFVIELRSKSTSPSELEGKIQLWIENGVQVAWMADPYRRRVTIYEAGQETRVEEGMAVPGTGPVEGFVLELGDVWGSYELPS
jgi:Uma2 family endonuclease